MIDQWYATRGAKKVGPLSSSQLKAWAAAGRLLPTDTVWKEGMDKGVLAAKVKNLFLTRPGPLATTGVVPDTAVSCLSPADLADTVEAGEVVSPSENILPPDMPDDMFPSLTTLLRAELDPPQASCPKEFAAPPEKPAPPKPPPVRKRRAIAVKGVVLLSQDGVSVSYRKKCTKCGYEDNCRSTMHIGQGVTRVNFFCPKCRKNQESVVQGVMQ